VPFAELSSDGGASWEQERFGSAGPGVIVTALTATPGGYTAATQSGAPGVGSVATEQAQQALILRLAG
jgi:hypothetical protein